MYDGRVEYVDVKIGELVRKFPVVTMGPKLRVAAVSLLGDVELVGVAAKALAERVKKFEPEVLVGPETKVVPLLQKMSEVLGLARYVVCRKGIQAYMISPVVERPETLRNNRIKEMAIDGREAEYLKGKRVVMVDDVVFTGGSYWAVRSLIEKSGGLYCGMVAVFKQGDKFSEAFEYLAELPVFGVEMY